MALSDDEKWVRKKVVGLAVKLLRGHLGITQPQLATLLDDGTDGMSVSKWERGKVTPHPYKRRKLAEIARKNGRPDLAATFCDPVENWKATLPGNPSYPANLLTLLEICVINMHVGRLESGADDIWYVALDEMACVIRDQLVEKAKSGSPVLLVTDAHRNYWFGMLKELGIGTPRKRNGKKKETGRTTR